MEYQPFVVEKFLNNSKGLKMLSIGSGKCKHELKFASHKNFGEILCIDISESLLNQAKKNAEMNSYNNMRFKAQNLYEYNLPENHFDVILFHASLHHFKNIDHLLGVRLKKNGILIINEYVGPNRLQFPKQQIIYINKALNIIPKKFRLRFKLNLYKNKIYGSGLLRMIIADPSECVESENIMLSIHKHYKTKYEVNLGGNLLMTVLKDLSHHFVELTEEKKSVLKKLFEMEDDYLKLYPSDYIFGIYENTRPIVD